MDTNLSGIRILDMTSLWAGPYTTRLLADMGAEVIKIEGPDRPDYARRMEQYADGEPGASPLDRSGFFNDMNRDKRGFVIDLTHPRGRELLLELVAVSDVVVENFTPRVLPKLQLDYQAMRSVNDQVILVSLPGFGSTGPYRDFLALGSTIEQVSGLSSITGYEDRGPHRCGVSYGDPVGGLYGAVGAIAALHRRTMTGEGSHVEIAQSEALTSLLPEFVLDAVWNDREPGRRGNEEPWVVPSGCFPCLGEDEWVAIGIRDDQGWRALCSVADRTWLDDDRFQTALDRWRHRPEIHDALRDWTRQRSADAVVEMLQDADVAAAPVATMEDLFRDDQLASRGYFVEIHHPEAGSRMHRGTSWVWDGERPTDHQPAPRFAGGTVRVLEELLDLPPEEIERLAQDGVVKIRNASPSEFRD